MQILPIAWRNTKVEQTLKVNKTFCENLHGITWYHKTLLYIGKDSCWRCSRRSFSWSTVERRSCHLSLKSVVLEKWKMLSPSRASISKAIRASLQATLQFVNNLFSSALAYALVHPMCTYNLPRSLFSTKASSSPSSLKRVFPLSRDDFQGKRAKRLTSCTFDRKENHFPENIKTVEALKTNNSAHWYIIQSSFFSLFQSVTNL